MVKQKLDTRKRRVCLNDLTVTSSFPLHSHSKREISNFMFSVFTFSNDENAKAKTRTKKWRSFVGIKANIIHSFVTSDYVSSSHSSLMVDDASASLLLLRCIQLIDWKLYGGLFGFFLIILSRFQLNGCRGRSEDGRDLNWILHHFRPFFCLF